LDLPAVRKMPAPRVIMMFKCEDISENACIVNSYNQRSRKWMKKVAWIHYLQIKMRENVYAIDILAVLDESSGKLKN